MLEEQVECEVKRLLIHQWLHITQLSLFFFSIHRYTLRYYHILLI